VDLGAELPDPGAVLGEVFLPVLFDIVIGRKRNVGGFALAGLGSAATLIWG
jgi:hypothetical protein